MKTIRILSVIMLTMAILFGCDESPQQISSVSPEATFDTEQLTITTTINQPVSIVSTITSPGMVSSRWYVNDKLEVSSAEFEYIFKAPGRYVVKYVAQNGSGEFSKEFEVVVTDLLQMELSTKDSLRVSRKKFELLKVAAIVLEGSDVVHSWKIDGVGVSTDAFFSGFALDLVKIYNVSYKGVNSAGSFEKSFEVNVLDRPLEISFSENAATIAKVEGEILEITATVEYGGTGIIHSWKVGEIEVATTATLSYLTTAAGQYIVSYYGENAVGESVTKSYTLNVTSGRYILDDFEAVSTVPARYTTGNNPGLSVIANEYQMGTNVSAKVLKIEVYGTGSTSGFFDISLSDVANVGQYKGLRFKIYRKTGNDYCPHIKFNKGGNNIAPTVKPTKFDEWETIEFIFPAGSAFGAHQLRPLSTAAGGNITTQGDRTMVMDDFELIK